MQMHRLFLYLQIFELAKNMNKKNLNWAIAITVIWLGVIGSTWLFGSLKSPKSLNELGDFFAGIFAPIAFFWLILGYIQQGKQLDQNTKALEQQERALQLQIEEMKNGIEQQVELVQLQRQQLDEQHKMLEPKFIISQSRVNSPVYENNTDENAKTFEKIVLIAISLTIENLGGDAFNLEVIHPQNKQRLIKLTSLLSLSSKDLRLELTHFQIDELNERKELEDVLDFSYECKNGRLIKYKLFLQIYQTKYPFYGVNLFLSKNDLSDGKVVDESYN